MSPVHRLLIIFRLALGFTATGLGLSAQTTFSVWQPTVFPEADWYNNAVSGVSADPDLDGLRNLEEFVFFGQPLGADSAALSPRLEQVGANLTLTFRQRQDLSGVDIRLQGSDTLTSWITYNTLTEVDRVTFTGYDEVTLLDPQSFSNAAPARRFLRLRLETPVPTELRPPVQLSLGVAPASPQSWSVSWTDPNGFETGHRIERRLLADGTWQEVGSTAADTGAFTHNAADYQQSLTYRVSALAAGGKIATSSPVSLPDTDGDGIPDALELQTAYTGVQGTFASDPNSFSSNGSGVSDGWQAANGYDPAGSFNGEADSDDDGLSDYEEYTLGTNPRKEDSDDDGVLDPDDGWAMVSALAPARLEAPNYALIPIGPAGSYATEINNNGQVILKNTNDAWALLNEGLANEISPPAGRSLDLVYGLNDSGNFLASTNFYDGNPLTVNSWKRSSSGNWIECAVPQGIAQVYGSEYEGYTINTESVGLDETVYGTARTHVSSSFGGFATIFGAFRWNGSPPELIGDQIGYSEGEVGQGYLRTFSSDVLNDYFGVVPDEYAADGTTFFGIKVNNQDVKLSQLNSYNGTYSYFNWNGDVMQEGGTEHHALVINFGEGELLEIENGVLNGEYALTNNNTIILNQNDGQPILWLDTKAGLRNDQLVDGSPTYTRLDWKTNYGEAPPLTLNAQMRGHDGNRIWQNAQWQDLAPLIPATQGQNATWGPVYISDQNDSGTLVGSARKTADNQTYAVLLVPVELTLSHPVVTSPEPPKYVVNADTASVMLTASVLGAADGTLIGWEIASGDGTLSHAESATVDGFARTTLATSTQVGATYRVTAQVKKLLLPAATPGGPSPEFDFETLGLAATDPTLRQTTDDITVIPGFAAAITVTRKNEDGSPAAPLPADGRSRRVLEASVRDAFGQPVAENTPVNWHLSGSGKLIDIEAFTDADGLARAVLVAGDATANQKIRVEADSYEITEQVENIAVTGTLAASASSLDLSADATTTLTLNVPAALNGAAVRWFTSLGAIENPVTTIANGAATATLRASGGRVGSALVTASVGGSVYLAEVAFTSSAPIKVEVEHPVIVGDASSDGTHPVRRADGTVENVAYRASTPVHIRAPAYAGRTATVRFGQVKPAADLLYRFDQLSAGTTPSATGNHPATVSGATLDTTRRQEGAASLFFDGEDAVLGVPDHSTVRLQSGLVISLWVHAADSGGSLVAKAGEYDLAIDSAGRATFTVQTSTGPTTLIGPALPLDAWIQVRAEYRAGGELRLSVGGTTASATAPGLPQPGTALVLVGENFGGWLDRLAFEAGEQFVAGTGLSVLGVDLADQIVLDANGQATVTLAGNGGEAVTPASPVLGVGIRVSINPEITLDEGVVVTTRENYAVLDATLGEVRVSTGSVTGPLTEARRAEVLAACLRELERTGQRAAALPFLPTGTAEERAKFGFRAILWMESTGQGVPQMRLAFENTEALPLTAEQRRFFEDQLVYLLTDAIRFGSDAMAEHSLVEQWGGFLQTLAQLSQGADFPALVLAADNRETFAGLGELHEKHGPGLIEELARLGQLESARNPTFVQRVVAGLRKVADGVADQWEHQLVTSTEGWLRDRTMQAVTDGKLDEVDAYYIGFAWGLCQQAYATAQMNNMLAAMRMSEQLASTVAAAWDGSQEARTALKSMIPVYGLVVMNDSTRALVQQGKYFDAGMGSAQESTAAIGTVTGAVQLMKAGTVAIIIKKSGKKVIKGGPPPLPASFGLSKSQNPTHATFVAEFKATHPFLNHPDAPKIQIHHAVPQTTLAARAHQLIGEVITPAEMHSLSNARGIPHDLRLPNGRRLHQHITNIWERWFDMHPTFTKQDLLDFATKIDRKYGHLFIPPI